MNVKHVVCPQKVLQAVTDLSLVRVCQERRVSVLSTERAVWPIEELTIDAAQIELCRRYRPLIVRYASRCSTAMMTDDVDSCGSSLSNPSIAFTRRERYHFLAM